MPADQKIKREIDLDYLAYLRSQPCVVWLDCIGVDCEGDIVVHQIPTVGAGGSDLTAIPMCVKHHAEIHKVGKGLFQKTYRIDLNREKINLLTSYIKKLKAEKKLC